VLTRIRLQLSLQVMLGTHNDLAPTHSPGAHVTKRIDHGGPHKLANGGRAAPAH
jgi:hypothetical protein